MNEWSGLIKLSLGMKILWMESDCSAVENAYSSPIVLEFNF